MPPEAAALAAGERWTIGLAPARPLRVADVALWYGERSGGIRTYLDAKREWAAQREDVEHHLVVPGVECRSDGPRHELRALTLAASNGYRLPLGTRALERALLEIEPELLLVHDPFWSLPAAVRAGRALGAPVAAVAHSSSALEAASLPGPSGLYAGPLSRWRRRAYGRIDAVVAAAASVDGARRMLPLRFGLDPAFRPDPGVERGDAVLYAGRLSREKGIFELLAAAMRSREQWRLRIVGCGPARGAVERLARRRALAGRVTVEPFISDRAELARAYAQASCVVMPGRFETFGLVALEAAASGASVVACESAPAARAAGTAAQRFEGGDVAGLLDAIERARRATPDPSAARVLAERHSWASALEAELADLRELVG